MSIPVLVLIYRLLGRAETRVVSSLLLWQHAKPAVVGGQRLQKLQKPLLFFLELIMLLLLTLAAAAPHIRTDRALPPLLVVLDDSFSMQAGQPSARAKALRHIQQILEDEPSRRIRFILAGSEATLLTLKANQELDARWQCLQPSADLASAIALARSLQMGTGQILVLSDQPPPEDGARDDLDWFAFGSAQANLAIVSATRNGQRCLVEVANFSACAQQTRLSIGETVQVLDLDAMARKRLIITAPSATQSIELSLPKDALNLDNQAILLPQSVHRIRVQLALADAEQRALFERTFAAIERVMLVDERADMLVVDGGIEPSADTWIVQIQADNASPLIGPYVTDHRHPISEGLSLNGVVWKANKDIALGSYRSVIAAGDVPLVMVLAENLGSVSRQMIRLNLDLNGSNLQKTENWPILLDNLVRWRVHQESGPRHNNLRLGEDLNLFMRRQGQMIMTDPNGRQQALDLAAGEIRLPLTTSGRHLLTGDGQQWPVVVNVLNADESNLSQSLEGEWLGKALSLGRDDGWISLVMPLLWALLVCALLHQVLVSRLRGTRV